jgi:glycosyltransferase involved in cell wall biosynthesis
LQVAGAEMLVLQIIERLRGRILPTLFCLDRSGALADRVQNQEVEIIPLGRRPGWDFRVAWRMARRIRRLGIEVLHAHQYSPFFYAALAKVLSNPLRALTPAGTRVKLIFTEHGRHYPDHVSFQRRFGNRCLLDRMADSVNAVSQFSADSLAHVDGFSRGRIEVIENGIDLAKFTLNSSPPSDLDPARRYIVNVARFHPVKDHATLLRAFQKLAPAHPDVDLVLIGDGELRQNLAHLSQEFGIQDRVRFLGIRNDVPAILHASAAFVLTSLSEGAPLTLLEAMAARLPVVVTAVGGMPEIVREGVEGLLAPRQDVDKIAACLDRLLRNAEMASTMGAAGARRVRESYTIDRTVDRYYALYTRLAGRA